MIHAISTRCPDCGSTLKLYKNGSDGSHFIGCTSWNKVPPCSFTQDYLPAMQELCDTIRIVGDAYRDVLLQVEVMHSERVEKEAELR